jgi:hypothetical protein
MMPFSLENQKGVGGPRQQNCRFSINAIVDRF